MFLFFGGKKKKKRSTKVRKDYDQREIFLYFQSLKEVDDPDLDDKFNPGELLEYEVGIRNRSKRQYQGTFRIKDEYGFGEKEEDVLVKPGKTYSTEYSFRIPEDFKLDEGLFGTIGMEASFDTDEEDIRKMWQVFVCEEGKEEIVSSLW